MSVQKPTNNGVTRRVQHRAKRTLKNLIALSAVALFGVVSAVVQPGSVSALPFNAGFNNSQGRLGLYYNDYSNDYVSCIDPLGPSGLGTNPGQVSLESAPITVTSSGSGGSMTLTYNANEAARMNWLLSTYSHTTDNVTAAAVELLGWHLASAGGGETGLTRAAIIMGGGPRNTYTALNYFIPRAGSSAEAVRARFYELEAESNNITAGYSTQPANPTAVWSNHTNVSADLTVTLGAGTASADLVLSNAVFADTASPFRTITSSGVFHVEVVQPPGLTVAEFEIAVDGVAYGFGGANVWPPEFYVKRGPGQVMAAKGNPPSMGNTLFRESDPLLVEAFFEPVLVTQVAERYYQPGDVPRDTVRFGVDTSGGGALWVKDDASGVDVPVFARGVLYGPFTAPQTPSVTPPAGAPVAGNATVVSAHPHNTVLTAASDTPVTTPGFYYWVWSINYADQPPETQQHLHGHPGWPGKPAYWFADSFGLVEESSVVPPVLTTTATAAANVGGVFTDTVHVTNPVIPGSTVQFSLFYLSTSPVSPVPVVAVCDNRNLVETLPAVQVTGVGDLVSPGVQVWAEGLYSWVAVLHDAAGVKLWEGECGEVSELTRVTAPKVATLAGVENDLVPTNLTDTFTVSGVVGEVVYETVAVLYEFDWVYDQFGGVYQTGIPVCTADTRRAITNPVKVSADGDYTTEPVLIEDAGVFGFVETTTVTKPDGEKVVVSRGECGDVDETVTVTRADMYTKVSAGAVEVGDTVFDVAHICGVLHEGDSVSFQFFHQNDIEAQAADTLVFTSGMVDVIPGTYTEKTQPDEEDTDAVNLEGDAGDSDAVNPDVFGAGAVGVDDGGCFRVASAGWVVDRPGGFYAVATVNDAAGNVLALDERGLPDESFVANLTATPPPPPPPSLVSAGVSAQQTVFLPLTGLAMLLFGVALTAAGYLRKKMKQL